MLPMASPTPNRRATIHQHAHRSLSPGPDPGQDRLPSPRRTDPAGARISTAEARPEAGRVALLARLRRQPERHDPRTYHRARRDTVGVQADGAGAPNGGIVRALRPRLGSRSVAGASWGQVRTALPLSSHKEHMGSGGRLSPVVAAAGTTVAVRARRRLIWLDFVGGRRGGEAGAGGGPGWFAAGWLH